MKKLFFVFFALMTSKTLLANVDSTVIPQVRFSPTMISNLSTATNKYVKVTYGQPFKKNRTVFGGIVPYGQLWRTGANEATEITINQEFSLNKVNLEKGTYTLFTIPNRDSWEIIINKKVGQWGTFSYDSTQNVVRFNSKVLKNENIYEGFTIELLEQTENIIQLKMMWDDVLVQFPIQISNISSNNSNKKKKKGLFRK